MYLQIFPSRTMRIGCYILASLSVTWWASVVVASAFQCQPVARAWHKANLGACFGSFKYSVHIFAPNIALDVLILGLPIWGIRKLHISRKQRFGLCSVFLLGAGVVMISSSFRLYYYIRLYVKGIDSDIDSESLSK